MSRKERREDGRNSLTIWSTEEGSSDYIKEGEIDRRRERAMEEIPEWQCGPEGGNWEHMGQSLPKLTQGEHEKYKKKEARRKKVLMFGVGGARDLRYFPSPLTYSLLHFSPHSLWGHFGWGHCSLTSFCSIVPSRGTCWDAMRGMQWWMTNTYKNRRAGRLQNNKQAKTGEAGRQKWGKCCIYLLCKCTNSKARGWEAFSWHYIERCNEFLNPKRYFSYHRWLQLINVKECWLKPRMMSPNVLSCQQPKDMYLICREH